MKKIVICFSFILFSSCSSGFYNIINCDSSSQSIKEHPFWSEMTCKVHDVSCEFPIVGITDFCVTDSFCYILFSDNKMVSVNLNNDKVCSFFSKIGHAKGEMITPSCIASDEQNVYIYDDAKIQIMKFSPEFRFETTIPICCYPNKIIKCKGGFLCYEMGNGAYLSYVNNRGKKKKMFKLSDTNYDCIIGGNPFVVDKSNKIYVKAELSDSLFMWKDEALELEHIICFDNAKRNANELINSCKMISSCKEYSKNYMILDQYVLLSSLKDKKIRFYLYDLESSVCSYGVPPKQNDKYPFIPNYQIGNRLFRIVPKSECKSFLDLNSDSNCENHIVIMEYSFGDD